MKNPDVTGETSLLQILGNDFWGTPLTHSGSHKSYRPLTVLTFRLNHLLHGATPLGFHFINVLLHSLATALFTHLARRLNPAQSSFPVWAAGLTFAAHPVHCEAVAGVVGRADVLACIFFLLSLLSYIQYCVYRDRLRLQRARDAMTSQTATSSEPGSFISVSYRLQRQTSSHSRYNQAAINYSNTTDAQTSSWHHDSHSKHSISSSGDDVNRDVSSVAKWAWLALSGACALCSMLSKEHGVTSLAVCAVYDVFVHSRIPIAFRTLTRIFKVSTCVYACTPSKFK